MTLKKANAALGLLSMALLVAHVAYVLYAYITFTYDPNISKLLGWFFAGAVAMHAALGMGVVMLSHDGSADLYPERNRRTIAQRASALGIVALLPVHVNTGHLIANHLVGMPVLILLIVAQLALWACVFMHIATSFTNAFVTLGLLQSSELKRRIDRVVAAICIVAFVVCAVVVVRTQFTLFSM